MGKTVKFDLAGGTVQEEANAVNMQRSINWYPVASTKSRGGTALMPTPGTTVYSNLSGYSFTGPFIKDTQGSVWTVARKELALNTTGYFFAKVGVPPTVYSNATFGNKYTAAADLGYGITQDALNLYMVAAVSNTDVAAGELIANMIVTADKRDPSATLTSIQTPVGIRSSDIAYLDGWLVLNHIPSYGNYNTTDANLGIFIVARASGNTTANVGTKFDFMYYQSDYVKRVIGYNGYLYLFGDQHYEVWYNSGNQDFPFEPIKEATQHIGLAQHWLITSYNNTIYFVGKDRSETYSVYKLKGLELTKISTQAIDNTLNSVGTKDFEANRGWRYYGMFTETKDGNVFIYINYGGTTLLAYNETTQLWHEDTTETSAETFQGAFVDSIGLDTTKYIRCLSNPLFSSSLEGGTDYLYTANYSTCTDLGTSRRHARTLVSPHVTLDDQHIYHNRVRVDFQFPTKISNDANIDANIWLYSSDDDGKTWNSHGAKSINNRPFGLLSGDKRVEWFRLGRSDDRVYKLWTNANTPVIISGAWLEAEAGYR